MAAPSRTLALTTLAALAALLLLACAPAAQARDLLQRVPKAAATAKPGTLLAYACNNAATTKFCAAATTAISDPKVGILNDPKTLATVFLPTDAGINKQAGKVRDELEFDNDDWTGSLKPSVRFVQNHIIPDRALGVASLKRGVELKSSLGQTIKIGDTSWFETITSVGGLFRSSKVVVQGEEGDMAKVITPDVGVGRSIVHVIDAPLIPDDFL